MQQHAMAWCHYEEEFFYHLDIMRLYSINISNIDFMTCTYDYWRRDHNIIGHWLSLSLIADK